MNRRQLPSATTPGAVAANRRRLAATIGAAPVFLRQVHGARVVRVGAGDAAAGAPVHEADACVTTEPGVACVVQAADCLPVLLAAPDGRAVGAAHAGWRGLGRRRRRGRGRGGERGRRLRAGRARGVARRLHRPEPVRGRRPTFWSHSAPTPVLRPGAATRFVARGGGKWLADLPGLARDRLAGAGVRRITGGAWCTVSERSRFFSYRRDGVTGRMAAAVWIDPPTLITTRLHGCLGALADADHDNAAMAKAKAATQAPKALQRVPQVKRAARAAFRRRLRPIWARSGSRSPDSACRPTRSRRPSATTSRRPERSGTGSWRPRRQRSAIDASPAPTGARTRRRPFWPSSICSTRARCCSWRRASRATPRPGRASASPCCSGSTPQRRATTSRSTPKRRRRRSRPRARACCTA